MQDYVAVSQTVAQAQAVIDASRLEAELKKSTDALVSSGTIIESEAQRIQGKIQELMRAFEMEGDAGKRLEIDKQITALFQQLDGADTVARAAASGFEPLSLALNEFAESVRAGVPDYIKLKEAVSEQLLLDPTNEQLRTLAQRLFEIIDPGLKVQSAMQSTAEGIKLAGIEARSSAIDVTEFGNAIRELAGIAVPALTDMEKAGEAFRKGMAGALDANDARAVLEAYRAAIARIQNEIDGANVPIPTPRPSDLEAWGEFGKTIDETAAKIDQFRSRADGLGGTLFPGEYALREAKQLQAELDLYGDKLDAIQRKAVEARIEEQFLAAALGVRDLGNETDRTGSKFDELGQKARSAAKELEDAFKDGLSGFLQDLLTGRDVLESIVQLGSRFASLNFDKLADAIMGGSGRPGQSTGAASAGKAFAEAAAPVLAKSIDDYVAMGGHGAGIGSPSRPLEVNLAQRSASNVQRASNVFLDLIGKYEGTDKGRGYNETLGYGAFTGGARNLVSMSLDQIDALQTSMLRHTENTFNSSALGRYQIVRTTLRGLRQELGLSGDQLFSPQLQDELAMQLARARGASVSGLRNEWQGFNNAPGEVLINAYKSGIAGAVEAGAKKGAATGLETGVMKLGNMGANTPDAASPQQAQNGLGQSLMGMLGAGLGGFSMGFQSQSPLMGALGGALQGWGAGAALGAAGGPIGAVIGGIAGFLGGMLGAKKKLEEAKKNLERNMKQIDNLLAIGEGRGIGENQKRITDFLGEIDKAVNLAWKAKEMDLVERLQESYNIMFIRLSTDFENAAPGAMRGYLGGRGREDPEVKGAGAVFNLREELRNWIADFEFFGKKRLELTPDTPELADERAAIIARTEVEVAQATAAARAMALAFLAGVDPMTEIQQAMGSIRGAADTLIPTLVELGMTQAEAAAAIESQVLVAVQKLRDEFREGIEADINDASGKGYLNDFKDLFEALKDMQADAASLGVDAGLGDNWFKGQAQSIVDSAQLIGPAFDALIEAFPQLEGVVRQFVEGIEDSSTRLKNYQERLFAATTDTSTLSGAMASFERDAARDRAAEIASGGEHIVLLEKVLAAERLQIMEDFAERARQRILGYENRVFAANNDTSTLAGQLAAFDRAAQQERIEEIKAGGEGIAALERALAAERLKIERDFEKQRQEEAKRRLDEAKSFLDGFFRSIREYVDNLKAGPDSSLPNKDRLAEAQRQFADQYAKVLTGDRDAANSITRYADNLRDAAGAFYGSTANFQAIEQEIIRKLEENAAVDAKNDERIRGLETEARKLENLTYRVTVLEQSGANLTKSVEELKAALNSQASDIRIIKEIVEQMREAQGLPRRPSRSD